MNGGVSCRKRTEFYKGVSVKFNFADTLNFYIGCLGGADAKRERGAFAKIRSIFGGSLHNLRNSNKCDVFLRELFYD